MLEVESMSVLQKALVMWLCEKRIVCDSWDLGRCWKEISGRGVDVQAYLAAMRFALCYLPIGCCA